MGSRKTSRPKDSKLWPHTAEYRVPSSVSKPTPIVGWCHGPKSHSSTSVPSSPQLSG